ncbi:MAG: hypothetical protein ABIW79_06245 [Gemmatimonas sp.]
MNPQHLRQLTRCAMVMVAMVLLLLASGCRTERSAASAADKAKDTPVSAMTAGAESAGDSAGSLRDSANTRTQGTTAADTTPAAKPRILALGPDTLRGVVIETGAEPSTSLLLVPAAGLERIALTGSAQQLLRRVVGLEVMVHGRLTGQRAAVTPGGAPMFDADTFIVRVVEGEVAHDGIVTASAGLYGIRTSDGTNHPVPYMPVALRGKVGARVFVAGSLERAPTAYGIIADAK